MIAPCAHDRGMDFSAFTQFGFDGVVCAREVRNIGRWKHDFLLLYTKRKKSFARRWLCVAFAIHSTNGDVNLDGKPENKTLIIIIIRQFLWKSIWINIISCDNGKTGFRKETIKNNTKIFSLLVTWAYFRVTHSFINSIFLDYLKDKNFTNLWWLQLTLNLNFIMPQTQSMSLWTKDEVENFKRSEKVAKRSTLSDS